ncbi:hypothetical protein PIB30_081476 [Stylosanthes scabra]|uniref:Uncharacterized protein n=1 Tax=Stylosanthes scabra TaxID=79078 RepID=A0ABU6ZQH7_9FABA|nr:hypothetical protein [Stylosanthes scabra]
MELIETVADANHHFKTRATTKGVYEQESRELREAHKKTEARLVDLIELLHKFTSQLTVNPQPSKPSSSTQPPSQPLPNPMGSINVIQTNEAGETEAGEEKDDGDNDDDWLYVLLANLAGESFDSEEECEEDVVAEEVEMTEVTGEVEVSSTDEEEEYFIAIVYGGNEEKSEEFPEKCPDPGPCFVTF